ncbi:RDD family protein [Candidatus Thiodubiliella endoseptemdiera]|uniref:RDD family protein n=1 Tax=Candidatus Thiodubiliella endoseptemdiera TaxID=2738886 RepID=UPI0034DE2E69
MNNEEYEYAGFWIRVGASLIDVLLLSIIILPLTIMIYGDLTWEGQGVILGSADFLINYTLPFIATILFWFYKSATPGKMALNIKIVDADTGGKLNFGQSIGRYFAYIPAMLIFMLGIIWVAFDKRKQGWHDKLSKTVVIVKRKRKNIEF